MDTTRVLAWTARLLGTTLLAFLLFMLVGALTGDVSSPDGFRFRDGKDLLGFLLFPVGTIIGLLLAYRWPLFGGLLAVGATTALVALRPDLLQLTFLVMVMPGLLYTALGLLTRRRSRTS
jgi:hypothetical protein